MMWFMGIAGILLMLSILPFSALAEHEYKAGMDHRFTTVFALAYFTFGATIFLLALIQGSS